MKNIKSLTLTALLAALTCVATMIIRFPTPSFGYIHLGDSLVLLSGFLLGPVYGAFAAGIGSMFADLLSGYATFAPGTLIIKALCAFVAGTLFAKFHNQKFRLLIGGVTGEFIMVAGYFFYQILLLFLSASATGFSLNAAVLSSASGIIFNIIQGLSGIIVSSMLYPLLWKNAYIRQLMVNEAFAYSTK